MLTLKYGRQMDMSYSIVSCMDMDGYVLQHSSSIVIIQKDSCIVEMSLIWVNEIREFCVIRSIASSDFLTAQIL